MSTPKLPQSTQSILKHYARLIRAWPIDHFRPVSFQIAMQKRLRSRFLTPTATSSSVETNQPSARARAEQTAANIQGTGSPSDSKSAPVEEKVERVAEKTPAEKQKDELEQVNAMYSLLENRYSRNYPCSERLLRPASNEGYYEALAQEMEAAPQRSWWAWKWMRVKGLVRMS